MSIFGLPVPADPARYLPKDPTAQIRHLDPGQDQKTGVVGDQPQVALALLGRPADKLVPVLTLPGRRAEHQAGQGSALVVARHVLQVLADRTAKTQIVKPAQRGPDPGTLRGLRTYLAQAQ